MTLTTLSGRRPSQNEYELRSFINLLAEYDVQSYLEIGARHGDTFYEVMTSLPPGSFGVAVDLPGGAWGTGKSRVALDRAVAALRAKGYRVQRLFGDSGAVRTVTTVQRMLRTAGLTRFGAVLIDGDHRYAGVRRDWEAYRHLANLVAFHDIVGHDQTTNTPERLPVQVPRLWSELKVEFPTCVEYVDDGSAMGIGVVCK